MGAFAPENLCEREYTMNEVLHYDDVAGDFTTEAIQLVSFSLGTEEFGIDILSVQEINRLTGITRVPNAPGYVIGVINLRGKIIPVVDLRKRFGMKQIEATVHSRIIVVEVEERVVGFLVDSVKEVIRIPKNIIEPPPSMVAGISSDYITGIGKLEGRLIVLLELGRILASEHHLV